jgi:Protein kinase domain
VCYKGGVLPVARVGTEVAGYRVERLLGRSAMSAVYLAENPRLGTKIALKMLAAELSANEAFRERFLRESRIAASLNHPSVVTIYDAGEWDGELFLAMQYVEGPDLAALLRSEGPLSLERTLPIASQVGDALDVAHMRGLIHRDVKPANILVEVRERDVDADRAYLSDFGVAKRFESRAGLTAPGELVGTVDYIAPEQIEGKRVDGRADVYSLACVVYQCLSGSPPFDKDTEAAVLWAHMQEEPPSVRARRPELPPDVDGVLATALAKSPDDRYATCREMISALGAARPRGEAESPAVTHAAVPTVVRAPRAPEARRSRPLALAALGAIGAALLVLGAGLGALLFGAGAETGSGTTTVVTTAPAADAEARAFERQLLLYLPAAVRRTCRPTPPPSDAFFASVQCRPGNGVETASYSLARSGPRLRDSFMSQLPRAGLPEVGPDERPDPRGDCATGDLPAVNEWSPRGPSGHQVVAPDGEVPEGGRVMCYGVGPRRWLIWTDGEHSVFAVASGRRLDRLYRWWRDAAGPGE